MQSLYYSYLAIERKQKDVNLLHALNIPNICVQSGALTYTPGAVRSIDKAPGAVHT